MYETLTNTHIHAYTQNTTRKIDNVEILNLWIEILKKKVTVISIVIKILERW